MPEIMKSYKYRFYPTRGQELVLARTAGCARFMYNRVLGERSRRWEESKASLKFAEASKMLTELRSDPDFGWLAESSRVPVVQALRDLERAFANFYAKRAGYPKFRSKRDSYISLRYTKSGFSWDQDTQSLKLVKMSEPLDIRLSRRVPSEPSSVTVSRDAAGRWHVSMLCRVDQSHHPKVDKNIGVDVGLNHFATFSDGVKVDNPRFLKEGLKRLALAQKNLARKKKGSNNREKARKRVAKVHARIADKRKDFLHKLSTTVVRENQTIAVEDLHVKGMVKNRRLSRSISDAGWAEFRRQLDYKSGWYGRDLLVVDRFYASSKTCSTCSHKLESLDLSVREWECPGCTATHDRDVNAAKNIIAAGLAVKACGDGVNLDQISGRVAVDEAGTPNERSFGIPSASAWGGCQGGNFVLGKSQVGC